MPCENATVPAPSADPAQISTTSMQTDVNQATLNYNVNNPNGFSVTVNIEHVVDGSQMGTETVTLSAGGSASRSFTATFDLSSDQSVTMCANHSSTERA